MRGEVWMDIRSDRQKGLSYTELGKKYHMDPRTAKRYAESPSRPEYTLTVPKPTRLDKYKRLIDEWLDVNGEKKMSIFAEMKCHFSAVSIAVYTALYTTSLAGLKPVKP